MADLVTGPGGVNGAREPVGTAGEEAARLADALTTWWARRDTADAEGGEGGESQPPGEPHGASCRHCPLCRGLAVAQSLRPEVVHHLLSAAESVVAALRELASDDGPARPEPDRGPPDTRRARTVRIPVDECDDCENCDGTHDGDAQKGH